jgi:hypothetical protein
MLESEIMMLMIAWVFRESYAPYQSSNYNREVIDSQASMGAPPTLYREPI